ncbi:MAG: hypothetical protein JWO31_1253 [Phycisphaerales bacterium]|nr:hypothetical protein [Phycisphaerales bacterium]
MDSSKLVFKLFLADPTALKPGEIVPVFHSLIQRKSVPDHMPIDVTDYEHVPDGPGSLLVTHEANIHLDHGLGRPGLMYVRKQPLPGDLKNRLRSALRYTLEIAHQLEQHPTLAGRVKFSTRELLFRINDRLNGPNTPETFAAVRPALEEVLAEAYPIATIALDYTHAPQELFEVSAKADTDPGAAAMLECLGFLPAVA